MKCIHCEEEVETADGDWCYVSDYDRHIVHSECNDIHNTKINLFLSRCCENCDHHSIEMVTMLNFGGDNEYRIKCNISKSFVKSQLNCDNFNYKLHDVMFRFFK